MQLIIEKLVYGGDGLARLPADEQGRGKAAFVPFVLPSETIEAEIIEQKPGFARARLQAVLTPSSHRIEAACPYFQKCGGCHYQHASYELQLESKAAILRENLRRIAKVELETDLVVHPSPPWNYRNRSRFKVQTAPEFALGYHKFASNELLPVEQCPISSPLINRAMAALWEMGRAGKVIGEVEEVEFFADADDAQLLVEVYCAPGISLAAAEELVQAFRAAVPQCSGVVAFRRPAPQTEPEAVASSEATNLQYRTEHGTYRVSAGAFFQVNRHLINALVKLATHGRPGQMALDLYAGAGLFSLPLARSFAQVIAVESSQTSQSDLAYNSAANVRPVRATVEQYLKDAPHKLLPDLIVLDPPRSGLGEGVVRGLAGVKAPRITYVSCDPSTLARDLGGLLKAGYRVEQAHLVDLFPQTFHLETVLQLVR